MQTSTSTSIEFPLFKELDHRLSVVKRWGILPTIQVQSVAEHCFNVERIAIRIAVGWFGIRDVKTLYDIRAWAHHHDDVEAVSGDIPTMIKPYIDEDSLKDEYSDIVPNYDFPPLVKSIVKMADLIEAYHFLAMEMRLGNTYVSAHHEDYCARIIDFAEATWPNMDMRHKIQEMLAYLSLYRSERYSRR